MKLRITVEVIDLQDHVPPSIFNRLPKDQQASLHKMPPSEYANKSILIVEPFPPKLIDNRAVKSYFPMLQARTFQEALQLIREDSSIWMRRGNLAVAWTTVNFITQEGRVWAPTPEDILSQEAVWYVGSKDQSYKTETELPGF